MSEGDTERPTIGPGERLTAAREQAGWSLLQAAERLHLDVASVKALEAGQFEALGAVVYARGHLRRYAEMLGLPANELEAAYTQANPSRQPPDLKRTATPLQHATARAGSLRPGTVAIGAVVLVMAALVWWAMHVPHAARSIAPAPGSAVKAPAAELAHAPTQSGSAANVDLGLKLGPANWATIHDPAVDANPLARGDTATGSSAARSADGSGRLFDVPAATPPPRPRSQRP
jgi:cytoskeleton protein RodZ